MAKHMDTKVLVAALIGLIVGAGGMAFMGERTDRVVVDNEVSGMHGAMGSMMSGLEGKTGDVLDKAFLSEMIVHHEGAVEMAQAILANGKHAELKTVAEAIVVAQTGEINQMKSWQKEWYGNE